MNTLVQFCLSSNFQTYLSTVLLFVSFLDHVYVWFFSGKKLWEMPMCNQFSWNIAIFFFLKQNEPKCVNLVLCDFWGVLKHACNVLFFSLVVLLVNQSIHKTACQGSFFQVPEAIGTNTLALILWFQILLILSVKSSANFMCKEPESKYFQCGGPGGFCSSCQILPSYR